MQQEPPLPRPSPTATGKRVLEVDPNSITQEGSTKSRRGSRGSDTEESEYKEDLISLREAEKQAKRNELYTEKENSPSMITKVFRKVLPGYNTERSLVTSEERHPNERHKISSYGDNSSQPCQSARRTVKNVTSMEAQSQFALLEEDYNQLLQGNEKKHEAERRKLEDYVKILELQVQDSEQLVHTLQARNGQLEFEKQDIEEQHRTFIRKQQETTFRQMKSSRWMPAEDSKVIEDLDRLKKDMRNWAKKATVNDMDTLLGSLGKRESAALKEALTHVVVFENGRLPQGLSAKKYPGLLLTALLTHHVYQTLFKSPFFFIDDNMVDGRCVMSEYRVGLEFVYRTGQYSNKGDAHIWRSDFLRLQLPPMTPETSEKGKDLHRTTEDQIVRVANRQASKFLEGAAQYIISNEGQDILADKLRVIYSEAASISYMLWTRRTALNVYVLENMRDMRFPFDNKYVVPHSSVNYEEHEDQLEGRALSIIVHPCLVVSGTDDAKNYDQRRVWAPAEVWLDSSVSSGN
ncbi:uncharacterized protein EAE97_006893 [Botrytis byssoidea]|uniref:Uncharacterized protein n=1 Tax=Botrytis byssoidea TaxID=139641 RepID=A0A9P5IH52_9HELO|nr:uncharacterized protein EAE97_006893 [Botrytis byssoidea]KAF7940707.1 hypothetical protein EAE97_006893 [Botrytis byssoidea]